MGLVSYEDLTQVFITSCCAALADPKRQHKKDGIVSKIMHLMVSRESLNDIASAVVLAVPAPLLSLLVSQYNTLIPLLCRATTHTESEKQRRALAAVWKCFECGFVEHVRACKDSSELLCVVAKGLGDVSMCDHDENGEELCTACLCTRIVSKMKS